MASGVFCRSVERPGWNEVYITVTPESSVTDKDDVRELFDRISELLSGKKVSVLQEKVYGLSSRMADILSARTDSYEKSGIDAVAPPTFIEGAPCVGGCMAGVQIIGVVLGSREVTCRSVFLNGRPAGRRLNAVGCSMIFLAGVSGLGAQEAGAAQAEKMLRRARNLLAEEDFSITDTVRTWIYFPGILDWYGKFNSVRSRCYRECGLIADDNAALPASTGIQGRRLDGEHCFMDLLAVGRRDGSRCEVAAMSNPRQSEAYGYGSSFSRGMAVSIGGTSTLYISGTASIGTDGKTKYPGDAQGQIVETLLDVASLLETKGARLKDICQATAFCKGEEEYLAFKKIAAYLGLQNIPFVPVFADICRDDLLFEMDAVAAVRRDHASSGGVVL